MSVAPSVPFDTKSLYIAEFTIGRPSVLSKFLFAACIGLIPVSLWPTQSFAQSCADHGVPINGFPNWMERGMLVMTNAARVNPTQYRDFFLPGAGNILSPSRYPAVPPIQMASGLNQSARAHSIEMAGPNGCGLMHNSCDGTTWAARIATYYPNWALLGENVAGGFTDPINVIGGLIADPYNGAPAPDGSGYDGHRWNIMYQNYTEVGTGFAAGTNLYQRYYTQDFGRPQTLNPICSSVYSGSHVFLSGSVYFLANFYDANNAAPQSANVVINGVSHPLTPLLGSTARGTYSFIDAAGSSCRSYHFEFVDAGAVLRRYPVRGELRTFNEGGCTEDYNAPALICAGDFNGNGAVSTQDLFDFINAWFIGDPRTDFNHNGRIEMQDIFDFMNAWLTPCRP